MRTAIFQLDAFTTRRFAGNPAAVMPLEVFLPDVTLQAIAAENNLAETLSQDARLWSFTLPAAPSLCIGREPVT